VSAPLQVYTCYFSRVTHLTAVSGANVTIVCAAVLFSARLIGPRAAVVLAAIALVAFVSHVGVMPHIHPSLKGFMGFL
jgi:predicted membrane metal-binding protein